ncbi:MAG: hypothetical protein R3185_07820 [Candidatus Thermoplasmatota archaeon]|nr:hypothetical protein [Candidatus Thermoplasmatota archaeon]
MLLKRAARWVLLALIVAGVALLTLSWMIASSLPGIVETIGRNAQDNGGQPVTSGSDDGADHDTKERDVVPVSPVRHDLPPGAPALPIPVVPIGDAGSRTPVAAPGMHHEAS